MAAYDKIILRDNLREDETLQSIRSAASVDIIPYGQELLDWQTAKDKYNEILCDSKSSVISEQVTNCYVRGRNLSKNRTVKGRVRVYLMPYNVFCNPKRWISLRTAEGLTEVPMISRKGGTPQEDIPAGEVCLSQSAFLIDDDYHLKEKEHYCLCAVVRNDNETFEIPDRFSNNIEVDNWIMTNPNVALFNVYPMEGTPQWDVWLEFGNLNSQPTDILLGIEFYCRFEEGERWPKEIKVRIQSTDSKYPFDFKELKISDYQEDNPCQSIMLSLYNVPGEYTGKLAVFIDNAELVPDHGTVKVSSYEFLKSLPKAYEEKQERLLPLSMEHGETGYLLPLGSCYVYNGGMKVSEFNRLREEIEAKNPLKLLSVSSLQKKEG